MIDSPVLVLNRSFFPIHITSVKRAFCMLYAGVAKAMNEQYEIFDFENWSAITASRNDETIGLVDRVIKIPRVIVLLAYDRLPKKHIRFSRLNIFARDKNTCQYCGKQFPRSELNLDHVIPRHRGGLSTWENVVCCCLACNKQKGGRTPAEAKMKLLRPPRKPTWNSLLPLTGGKIRYEQWRPFLNMVDISYWYTELLEE
ncbi:MAG: HNH endonuclease [Candidatus Bathyarchaeia archaeon]